MPENCKWGIRKRFQSGEIGVANKRILGYRYDEEQKKYLIVPEEADPIQKNKVKNHGELPQYYMTDCHEAIINRETYANVKAEMKRRASLINPIYCFTAKIHCGICGANYARKQKRGRHDLLRQKFQ